MDIAETNVATTVHSPATRRIGRGSAEPEPWPSLGRMPAADSGATAKLIVVVEENVVVVAEQVESQRGCS